MSEIRRKRVYSWRQTFRRVFVKTVLYLFLWKRESNYAMECIGEYCSGVCHLCCLAFRCIIRKRTRVDKDNCVACYIEKDDDSDCYTINPAYKLWQRSTITLDTPTSSPPVPPETPETMVTTLPGGLGEAFGVKEMCEFGNIY